MTQFYAQADDEEKCRDSIASRIQTSLTGLTMDGKVRAFTGRVQFVEIGQNAYAGYPLRVTMRDAK